MNSKALVRECVLNYSLIKYTQFCIDLLSLLLVLLPTHTSTFLNSTCTRAVSPWAVGGRRSSERLVEPILVDSWCNKSIVKSYDLHVTYQSRSPLTARSTDNIDSAGQDHAQTRDKAIMGSYFAQKCSIKTDFSDTTTAFPDVKQRSLRSNNNSALSPIYCEACAWRLFQGFKLQLVSAGCLR